MHNRVFSRGALGFALLACLLVPMTAGAQTPTEGGPQPAQAALSATMLRGGELGELLSVYVPRSEGEIQRLLDAAREAERSATSEIEEARRLAADADGRVRIMSEEIQTTKVRRDVAKKAKDGAARADLDATVKRQTREKQYLERMRQVLRSDAGRLESEREAAGARVKSLELELDVARQYAALAVVTATPEAIARYRSSLSDLLNAQKQAADRAGRAAGDRKQVAERRLKQLQSLTKLLK